MWLTKLKIAIAEKNPDTLGRLIEDVPQLESKEEINEARYLIQEAVSLLITLRDEAALSMKQIKKNLAFLKSTENQKTSKLDIKS